MDKKLSFVLGLRTAARLLNPHVVTDQDHPTEERYERALRRAALWLTPGVVKDYDPSFFPELSDDERARLSEDVREFAQLAASVPPTQPVDEGLLRSAEAHLIAILETLRPYLLLDARMFQVWIALDERLASLEQVLAVFPDIEEDSSGEEAVRVYVILDDALAPESDEFAGLTREAKERARDAVAKVHPDLWPYVEFHSASEQLQYTGWTDESR